MTTRVCILEIWLCTFLSALLGFSYVSLLAPSRHAWLHWPLTVSSLAVATSVVAMEIAARRVHRPEIAAGGRRLVLYFCALIIGVILEYSITAEAIGPRGFRIGIFLLFGLPLFAWLAVHLVRHYRSTAAPDGRLAQKVLGVFACVLFVIYVAVTLLATAA